MSFHPLPGREVAPTVTHQIQRVVMIRGSEARAFRRGSSEALEPTLAHGQI